MKRFLLILFVVLAFSVVAQAQTGTAELIGYKYQGVNINETLPNGFKHIGAGMVSEINKKPIYAVSRFSKGATHYLFLDKAVAEDAEGSVAEWEIRDAVVLPNFGKNQEILLPFNGDCKRGRKVDDKLIVLADFSPKTKTYKVLKAWRPNLAGEKIEAVSIRNIQCTYDEP